MNKETTPQPQTKAALQDREVAFKPFGGGDELRLSINIIRNQIAVPYKHEDGNVVVPDDRQCIHFMMLCKARQLNPFEGDAFMIPFWDRDAGAPRWNLITAHQTFLKRAEVHPDYDGKCSGIIVESFPCHPCSGSGVINGNVCPRCTGEGVLDELPGDYLPEGTKLLGGWCRVYYRNKKHPEYQRLKLSTYQKNFGVWRSDSPGMICKCAEAAALRSAFPTTLGGMYLREELQAAVDIDSEPVFTKPDFGPATIAAAAPKELAAPKQQPTLFADPIKPPEPEKEPAPTVKKDKPVTGKKPAPMMVVKPPPEPEPPPEVVLDQPEPEPEVVVVPESKPLPRIEGHYNKVRAIRNLCRQFGVEEGSLIDFVASSGAMPAEIITLEGIETEAPDVLDMIHDDFGDLIKRMQKLKGQTK